MATGDDKPGEKVRSGPPPGALGPPGARDQRKPGDGVQYDQRGNAIWKWAVDTGKHAIDSTSRLLKRLEVPELTLDDDDKGKLKPGKDSGGSTPPRSSRGPAGPPSRTAGHDPYGRKTGTPNPHVAARAARSPSLKKPATASPPRKSWWRRLFQRR